MTDDFEKYDDMKLIEAIEERGYFVVYKDEALSHLQTEELEEELFNRNGKWTVDKKDYETMKDVLVQQGYKVYDREPDKELLEELYRRYFDGRISFMKYLNELFMKRLEKWI